MVYSTCTCTPEENEENVHWALQTLPVELLDAREQALAFCVELGTSGIQPFNELSRSSSESAQAYNYTNQFAIFFNPSVHGKFTK